MKKVTDERLSRQALSNENVKSLTSVQRAALAVAKDYPVFPCDPVSKGPIEKGHGFKDATQDAAIVAGWWRKYPEALIGVPTGTRSGLLAIDCDPKSGDWFARHKRRLGRYRLHQTRRGKHLLYRYPAGSGIRNSQKSKTIDVRGEGGYVIWWAAHGAQPIGDAGEAPEWLVRLCKSLSEPVREVRKLNGHGAPQGWAEVPEGQRDDWLSARAYSLVRAGWGEQKVLDTIRALSDQHCKPPKTEKELLRIVRGKRKFIDPDATPLYRTLDEVREEAVDWLWKGFLARNKVHIIAGAGATMKSTLTLSLAATITKGGVWPDGTQCPRGNVILWTGEDDLGDTVKPRFRWAGGDQRRCAVLEGVAMGEEERAFDPAQDMAVLERLCATLGDVSLIIIDPIVVIVEKDNNSVNDVRRALAPLMQLAKRYHCVVLGIQHFNKGSKGKDPVERITGSGGWSQAPRIVLATAPIVDGEGKDPTKFVFTCIKTFAKKQKGGYEYSFEEEPQTEIARIAWGKQLEGTGLSIITEAEGGEDGESKLGAAKKFLRGLLSKGSMNGTSAGLQALDAGITGRTLARACEALNVKKFRVGKNQFRWRLPDSEDEA